MTSPASPPPETPPEPARPKMAARAEVDVPHPLSAWLSGDLEIILASGGVWRWRDVSADDARHIRDILEGTDTDEDLSWDSSRWVSVRVEVVAGAAWQLAPRQPTATPVGHRREMAAHGHPKGWLNSLRRLYAGAPEPSFSAQALAVLARYARSIDRAEWDLLAMGVEGDGADGLESTLAAWTAAHPDADADGDDESGDAASWAPDADDGSASTPAS